MKQPNEGLFNTYSNTVKQTITEALLNSFSDGLSLIFGWWIDENENITNCLRDDVWEIKALQEQILNELLKAALLSDSTNTVILWEDYQLLERRIQGGEMVKQRTKINVEGLKKEYHKTSIWFPEEGRNYYVSCPYGDFTMAFDKLKQSLDNFANTFRSDEHALGTFASMKKAAKKRAIKKAEQWIQANQITYTLGGGGHSSRSLVNGPGMKGLEADIETELGFIQNYGDLIAQKAWKEFTSENGTVGVAKYIQSYQDTQSKKKLILDQMETAMKYNLSLSNVSEQSLYKIEEALVGINSKIKQAYTTKISDYNLTSFCEKLLTIAKKQCKNKDVDIPNC